MSAHTLHAIVLGFLIWAIVLVPILAFFAAVKRARDWGDEMARRAYQPPPDVQAWRDAHWLGGE